MTGLSANNLTCIKSDRVLFESLSLLLSPGQLIYLRGPNGAGKTSLLRILSGLSEPADGFVYWNGQPLGEEWLRELIYIGHKTGMNGALSAVDNLNFWSLQHGVKTNSESLFVVLEELGLVGLEALPLKMLSAGQQRRAALARLWLKTASVWILDEPFTALDKNGVQLIEGRMQKHLGAGGAIIATSHQPVSDSVGEMVYFDLEYQH